VLWVWRLSDGIVCYEHVQIAMNFPGVLTLVLLLWSGAAVAHITSTGVAVLDIQGDRLSYRLTLVPEDVDPLYVPILQAAGRGEGQAIAQVEQALRAYARFAIHGEACTPERAGVQPAGTRDGKLVLEMVLTCAQSVGTLWIRDDWPEVLGAHFQTVMTVNVARRIAGQFVFLDDRREATLELHVAPVGGWTSFILMGAEHMLGGPDHLLFLLALLALSRGLWSTVKIVTGFTLAHSITLSLATLGWVDVPSRIAEPLIAGSIVWVAVENLVAPQSDSRRWLVAAFFGLVHGLGLANGLLELGLPREALVPALIGFNLGVELGQLLFVAIALPAIIWASRPGRLTRLPQVMSLVAAAGGIVWLLLRVFFSP
jgi:hypothetical protein